MTCLLFPFVVVALCGTMESMKSAADTNWIMERAREAGFALCGVVCAEKFPELAQSADWLARGYAGEMKYLADPRRKDPQAAMPGIRSVVVCALNYNVSKPYSTEVMNAEASETPRGWLSRYAWGDDYHEVLWEKLESLKQELRTRFSETFEARVYADTGPIQERTFAKYAGLGWIGKNTLLLNQEIGSYFFLGTILTTLDLQPSVTNEKDLAPDRCGTCRRCIEACPTDALLEPYLMDARLCISYLTIELRGSISTELREHMGQHVYGCDICQDVCPWNSKAPISDLLQFQPRNFAHGNEKEEKSLFHPELEWLASMSEAEFREVFRGSPVKRTKWQGLVRNACIALGNSHIPPNSASYSRICSLLKRLTTSSEPAINESAFWALSRIKGVEKKSGLI